MNNDELKKKIAQIIADYFCPQRNEHKNLWGDDRLCYSKMNFAECERVAECTDALIAAGIGDVKESENKATAAELVAQVSASTAIEKIAEWKHRAEVAEKALREACSRAWSIECTCPSIFEDNDECSECYKNQSEKRYEEKDAIGCLSKKLLEQAEKELAEEGKMKIKEYFQRLVKAVTIPQEPMNYDAATLKIYIDHLEAENAALRSRLEEAVGGWISIEERLPETDNKKTHDFDVLVYVPKRDGCRQHGVYLGKLSRVNADDGTGNFWGIKTEACEWTVWGWSYFEYPVVTHWKPLPPLPIQAEVRLAEMKGGKG